MMPVGQHPDLVPGKVVDVIVGAELSDHGGSLRVFDRADGNGRFILREADTRDEKRDEFNQLAVSATRGHGAGLHCRDDRGKDQLSRLDW